jgi:hypothetical protein
VAGAGGVTAGSGGSSAAGSSAGTGGVGGSAGHAAGAGGSAGHAAGAGGSAGSAGSVATCKAKTCSDLNYNCSTLDDGCGHTLNCGTCDVAQTCGGGGYNRCGNTKCLPQADSSMYACAPIAANTMTGLKYSQLMYCPNGVPDPGITIITTPPARQVNSHAGCTPLATLGTGAAYWCCQGSPDFNPF